MTSRAVNPDLPNPTTCRPPQIDETQCFPRPGEFFSPQRPWKKFWSNHPGARPSSPTIPTGPNPTPSTPTAGLLEITPDTHETRSPA